MTTATEVFSALKKHPQLWEEVRRLFLGEVPTYGWVVQELHVTRAPAGSVDNTDQIRHLRWYVYLDYHVAVWHLNEKVRTYQKLGQANICKGPYPVHLHDDFLKEASTQNLGKMDVWWEGQKPVGPEPVTLLRIDTVWPREAHRPPTG